MSAIRALSFSQVSFKPVPFLRGAPPSAPWLSLGQSASGRTVTAPLQLGSPVASSLVCPLHAGEADFTLPASVWEGALLGPELRRHISCARTEGPGQLLLPFGCCLDDGARLPTSNAVGGWEQASECFNFCISLHLPQACPPCTPLICVTPATFSCE